jgi:hypothetical protein
MFRKHRSAKIAFGIRHETHSKRLHGGIGPVAEPRLIRFVMASSAVTDDTHPCHGLWLSTGVDIDENGCQAAASPAHCYCAGPNLAGTVPQARWWKHFGNTSRLRSPRESGSPATATAVDTLVGIAVFPGFRWSSVSCGCDPTVLAVSSRTETLNESQVPHTPFREGGRCRLATH